MRVRRGQRVGVETVEGGSVLVTYAADITPEQPEDGEAVSAILHGVRGGRSWNVTIRQEERWGDNEVVLSSAQFAAVVRLAIQAGVTVL